MALRILWSQKEDPLDMQYCTLEGNNTLAERVRDAEPPSKRKKIRADNNNDKGQEGEEAASAEAEVEAEVDTETEEDTEEGMETEEEEESGDSDEEPVSLAYLQLLRKIEVKHKDSDLEFLAYDEQNFTIDYADSQDLWESEDRRKSDYGFGADTEEDTEEETDTEGETEEEEGGVSGDSQDDEGRPWF